MFEEGTDDAAAQLSVGRPTGRFNAARTYAQSVATFEDSLGGGIQMYNNRTCADDDDAVSNTVDGPSDVTRVLSEVLDVNLGTKRLPGAGPGHSSTSRVQPCRTVLSALVPLQGSMLASNRW